MGSSYNKILLYTLKFIKYNKGLGRDYQVINFVDRVIQMGRAVRKNTVFVKKLLASPDFSVEDFNDWLINDLDMSIKSGVSVINSFTYCDDFVFDIPDDLECTRLFLISLCYEDAVIEWDELKQQLQRELTKLPYYMYDYKISQIEKDL